MFGIFLLNCIMAKKYHQGATEIRYQDDDTVVTKLHKIADKQGLTLTQFLRQQTRKIIRDFEESTGIELTKKK